MRKLCSLSFEEVVSMENLCEAWQEFIRGKRNKKDVQEFMRNLGDELAMLHQQLMNGDYRHGPYRHFAINDPKPRSIHKASVRDRLLHHAIHRKLYPFFARIFVADSFSCQTGKGVHRALRRFVEHVRSVSKNGTQTGWILKCDIRKFFASIDHTVLFEILRSRVTNRRLLELLEHVIGSFEASPGKGIPLGNLTSQLFSNICMHEFDDFVKRDLRLKRYVRYADDFVLFSRDRSVLLGYLPRLEAFLSGVLTLHLHPDKVSIKTIASGVDFLGWVHFPNHRVLRTKVKNRIFNAIRNNPKQESLQSYLGLMKHGDAFDLRTRLLNDYWLWSDPENT